MPSSRHDGPDRSPAPEALSQPAPVAASAELTAPVNDGVELCYQTFGAPDGDPLVLVMGLGGPMTWWDEELCRRFARAGFFVVRFDNRDVGRSTWLHGRVRRVDLVRGFLGRRVRAPYALTDLADDVAGLLDHLGLASAHVAGVSMGGMVAQTVALTHPRRVRSLASFSSTTGRRTVGWQHPVMLRQLLVGGGAGKDAYVQRSLLTWGVIGSPAYPVDRDELVARAEETYDRGVTYGGLLRQMLAIVTQPDRTARLGGVRVPTLVVHGLADKMVHVSGGRATSHAVPGSELLLIEGMGHDLPAELYDTFVGAVRRTADRA
jgi:pimeloyl-ACP methyl ester carboxylesterase